MSLVVEPLAGVRTTGASGTSVSTVKELVLDSGLVLPAASLAVAFTVWRPFVRPAVGVKLQAPEASAVQSACTCASKVQYGR